MWVCPSGNKGRGITNGYVPIGIRVGGSGVCPS